jgi:hypothetical protein
MNPQAHDVSSHCEGCPATCVRDVLQDDNAQTGAARFNIEFAGPQLAAWMADPSATGPDEQFQLSLTFLLDGITTRLG